MSSRAWIVLAALAWWAITTGATLPSTASLTSRDVPVQGVPYAAEYNAAADRHGVDAGLLVAIGRCESNYNPQASSGEADGLMQFTPETARAYGVDVWDPASSIDGAARYLADSTTQLDTTDPALLAASYNAGRGAVQRHNGIPPYAETRRYVDCVTRNLS